MDSDHDSRKRTVPSVAKTPYKENVLIRRFGNTPSTRATYECASYQPIANSKRCEHYLEGGACSLPGELMCVEWLRANGRAPAHLPPPRRVFQLEVQQQPTAPASKSTAPVNVDVHDARMALPAIPADDIAAFKSAGVEVQLAIGDGVVHLVPEYTQQARIELSIEHAATLRRLLDAFPGARIAKLSRVPSAKEPRHG